MAGFDLPRLQRVLPAMVRAYVATHTYRLEPSAGQMREPCRLILHDTGHGAVVGRIMMLLTEVVAPVHGDEGHASAAESRRDLAQHLFAEIDRLRLP